MAIVAGDWACAVPTRPKTEHGNAAAHTSANPSKIKWFARIANESLASERPFYRNRTTGLIAA
jgi:hypothetical protein